MTNQKENFTAYEWAVELVDKEYGDILDLAFSDKCPEIPSTDDRLGASYGLDIDVVFERLVLVRDVYRNWDLSDRSWAYVEDGKLPEYFSDPWQQEECKVPKRFHAEIEKKEVAATCKLD